MKKPTYADDCYELAWAMRSVVKHMRTFSLQKKTRRHTFTVNATLSLCATSFVSESATVTACGSDVGSDVGDGVDTTVALGGTAVVSVGVTCNAVREAHVMPLYRIFTQYSSTLQISGRHGWHR